MPTLPRWFTAPAGQVARTVGRTYDYLTPGSGTSSLTQAGRNATNIQTDLYGNPMRSPTGIPYDSTKPLYLATGQTATSGYDAPTADTSKTTTYNGSGSGSGRNASGYYGNYTPDQVNALNSQLSQTDNLLTTLGVARDAGLKSIDREYGQSVGRAQEDQARFNRDLNVRRQDNQNNKTNSLNRINTDAENKFNSVMRMLGIRGAGVSSAAQMVAPHLVAQNASNQRADQFDTFGRNMGAVDRAQTDSDLKYKNLFEDLLGQRNTKENHFRQKMVNQENELYGTRADIQAKLAAANGGSAAGAFEDYGNRLAANQVTLDDLIRASIAPQYNVKAVDTQAPNLEQYTADPLAVNDPNAVDPTASEVNAYLPWLQRKEKLGLY